MTKERLLELKDEYDKARRYHLDLSIANEGAMMAIDKLILEFDAQKLVDENQFVLEKADASSE